VNRKSGQEKACTAKENRASSFGEGRDEALRPQTTKSSMHNRGVFFMKKKINRVRARTGPAGAKKSAKGPEIEEIRSLITRMAPITRSGENDGTFAGESHDSRDVRISKRVDR
jgi:hypothetical protein